MTSSLRERAEAARLDRLSESRAARDKAREDGLEKVLEKWGKAARGEVESFSRVAAHRRGADSPRETPSPLRVWSATESARPPVSGWSFELDGVEFLAATSYQESGSLFVVLTCPKCGARRAEHFYGLDSLGDLLRKGHGTLHKCLDLETRQVAYAIASAARDLNLSADEIVRETFERQGDLIWKVMQR